VGRGRERKGGRERETYPMVLRVVPGIFDMVREEANSFPPKI
jgi:hypothetical protein